MPTAVKAFQDAFNKTTGGDLEYRKKKEEEEEELKKAASMSEKKSAGSYLSNVQTEKKKASQYLIR